MFQMSRRAALSQMNIAVDLLSSQDGLMDYRFSLITLDIWVRHRGRAHLQRGDARNQQEWDLSQTPPLQALTWRLSCTAVVVGDSPNTARVMSLWTTSQKVWQDAINICSSEGNLRAMQGREVCMLQTWLLFAVSLYSQPLHPDRISGAWSKESEAACRTALGMWEFQ